MANAMMNSIPTMSTPLHPLGSAANRLGVHPILLYQLFRDGGRRRWLFRQVAYQLRYIFVYVLLLGILTIEYDRLFRDHQLVFHFPVNASVYAVFIWGNAFVSACILVVNLASVLLKYIGVPDAVDGSIQRHRGESWNTLCDALSFNYRDLEDELVQAQNLEEQGLYATPVRVHAMYYVLGSTAHFRDMAHIRAECRRVAIQLVLLQCFTFVAFLVYLSTEVAAVLQGRRFSCLYDWSLSFKLAQREDHELPHEHRQRMKQAVGVMDKYVQQHLPPCTVAWYELFAFVSGSLAMIILLLSYVTHAVATTYLLSYNLVWYVPPLTLLCLAIVRMLPNERETPMGKDDVLHLLRRGTTWTDVTRAYGFVPRYACYNVWSFVTLPWFLWRKMPRVIQAAQPVPELIRL